MRLTMYWRILTNLWPACSV